MIKPTLFAGATLLLSLNCAHVVMAPPQATIQTTEKLRASNMATVQIGTFSLSPNLSKETDASMSMRGGNSVASPIEGSFTQYLKATLTEELKAAGLLDPKAKIVITATLVGTELHTNIGTATGFLKARFVVTRDGQTRFDRELTADDSWESSFMAAVAVPTAAAHYQGLFRKMVDTLIGNPEFQTAVAR